MVFPPNLLQVFHTISEIQIQLKINDTHFIERKKRNFQLTVKLKSWSIDPSRSLTRRAISNEETLPA